MRIVVCVKHVPDTQSERRIEDGRIVRGEDDVLNELDENAVEAAVQLVEDNGGEVIALTMGPEDAEDALMRSLQMGVDRAVLVTDERLEGADVTTTAAVLAGAITRMTEEAPVDLVITGMASLDAMTSMLPAALATELAMPLLGLAHELDVDADAGTVEIARNADGYDDRLRAPMPAVVSVTDQINEPRYPAFAAMKAARSKPKDQWSLNDLKEIPGLADGSLFGSSMQVVMAEEATRDGAGTIVTDAGDAGTRLARYLLDVVK